MRLKSYFANSVQGAINKARIELGPDAMLVNTRQTDPDLKDVGSYEVVFSVPPAGESNVQDRPAVGNKVLASGLSDTDLMRRELAELRKQLEMFRQSVSRATLAQVTETFTPELSHVYHRLLDFGFSADLAKELTEVLAVQLRPRSERPSLAISEYIDPFTRDLLSAILQEAITSRFGVDSSLGQESERSAIMLVGAPGAGKTTSLVKLGFQYGLKARRPLHLLSLDTLRMGGCDQLSKYARIGGVGFRALPDSLALARELESLPRSCLALIDTPGFAKADEDELDELGRRVRTLPIEVHLVMPAFLNLDIALETCRRFASLAPTKLLLTHLDAIQGTALPIELSIRSGLALSFFGTGQQVPEDLQSVDKTDLMREIARPARTLSMAA